ncbi:MAG: T9SS type A sorting domain-containing protein [Bacteroidia bacterium]
MGNELGFAVQQTTDGGYIFKDGQIVSVRVMMTSTTTVTSPVTLVASGGTVTTLCTTVGISPTPTLPGGEGVAVAPNPTEGEFEIELPEGESTRKAEIEIYDVYGIRVFYERIFNETKKKVRLDVASGVYFVKVRMGGKGYCEKIVIEREFRR